MIYNGFVTQISVFDRLQDTKHNLITCGLEAATYRGVIHANLCDNFLVLMGSGFCALCGFKKATLFGVGSTAEGLSKATDRRRLSMSKPNPHSISSAGLIEMLTFCRPLLVREAMRLKRNLRRAEKRDLAATLTFRQWLTILNNYEWRCALCRQGRFETMEHLIPICDGGGTTAQNCVPCCEECNRFREQASTRTKNLRRQLADLLI